MPEAITAGVGLGGAAGCRCKFLMCFGPAYLCCVPAGGDAFTRSRRAGRLFLAAGSSLLRSLFPNLALEMLLDLLPIWVLGEVGATTSLAEDEAAAAFAATTSYIL